MHFHCVIPDGAFVQEGGSLRFVELAPPSDEDPAATGGDEGGPLSHDLASAPGQRRGAFVAPIGGPVGGRSAVAELNARAKIAGGADN